MRIILTLALLCCTSLVSAQTRPQLTVDGDRLEDPQGNSVIIRGLATMGMGMVYGNEASPGGYIPITPIQFIDRATQTDADGEVWYSTAIRLNFERYPSVNTARLYTTENVPYAMPDTTPVSAWSAGTYQMGEIRSISGSRYVCADSSCASMPPSSPWRLVSDDYDQTEMNANFAAWKAAVMDPVVDRAVANGLYVVICEFDFGPAHHPTRYARMLDFWQRMAASSYKNHPNIIFELWNESETIGTYDGGPGSWATQKPYIEDVIDVIRNEGANNIIIIPPPFYSAWIAEATSNPISGTNLAYSLHQYREQWEAFSSNRDQINTALASNVPVIMTEWGDGFSPNSNACNGGGSSNPLLQWPDFSSVSPALRELIEPSDGSSNPVAGWFAWSHSINWCPTVWENNSMTDPAVMGIATRQWLEDMRFDSQPEESSGNSPTKRMRLRVGLLPFLLLPFVFIYSRIGRSL